MQHYCLAHLFGSSLYESEVLMCPRLLNLPPGRSPLPVKDGLNPSRARVPEEFHGRTAWEFAWHLISTQRRRAEGDDEQGLQKRFDAAEVIIGPKFKVASPDTILRPNEDLWFYRIPFPEKPLPYQCETIFEDDHLLVVDKPPFMATMPRGMHIVNTATVQLRRATGNDELSPAHRLDRLTSGVLVFTKTKDVRGTYQVLFAERRANKVYEATARYDSKITDGIRWESRIEKTPGQVQARNVDGAPNAFTVVESVRALDIERQRHLQSLHGTNEKLARYVLKPLTGKTHQLRMHMLSAGVPILGDPAYPTVKPLGDEDYSVPMHLTAKRLEFEDPFSGEHRSFEALRTW